MEIIKAIVVIIVGLLDVILRHITRVRVASCRHCYAMMQRKELRNHIQSIGLIVVSFFMHQEVNRGKVYHPMPTILYYHPAFAPPALRRD